MSDWGGYGSIRDEARKEDEAARRRGDRCCPVCGNSLTIRDDGRAICDVGHYETTVLRQGG